MTLFGNLFIGFFIETHKGDNVFYHQIFLYDSFWEDLFVGFYIGVYIQSHKGNNIIPL